MTTRSTLYVDQGIDFVTTLDLFKSGDVEYDITNQTFKCQARKVYSSKLAFEADIVIHTDDNDENNLDLVISANTTIDVSPGKYQYDIIMTEGSTKTKILEGLLFVIPTMTR